MSHYNLARTQKYADLVYYYQSEYMNSMKDEKALDHFVDRTYEIANCENYQELKKMHDVMLPYLEPYLK